jgi:dipeptidyl aminopeptidase/acylaminoacyl peptidase
VLSAQAFRPVSSSRHGRLLGAALGPLLLASLALFVAPAHATIAYEKDAASLNPSIWLAEDSGRSPRQLARPGQGGTQPLIAPSGSAVIFSSQPAGGGEPELKIVPSAGGAITTLASNEQNMSSTAWSPDSKTVATVLGEPSAHHVIPTGRLVLIDVASGLTRTIATGSFEGVSFSPDSTQLAYARSPNQNGFPTSSDIYTVPVAGGAPLRITGNHRSTAPVWGPTKIAFARTVKAKRKEDAPKSNIWLMNPNGSQARQLTRAKAPFLTSGPSPLAFSGSGSRLIAEFGGQDTSYGQGVNLRTGALHTFSRKVSIAYQLIAEGISRDGSTVLGLTGGLEPSRASNIVTVPFAGGPLKVLIRGAYAPSWNG